MRSVGIQWDGEQDIPNDKHSGILGELIRLSSNFKINLTMNGVSQVNLAVDHIRERRCTRIYVHIVGHKFQDVHPIKSHLQNQP
jgi:hypothetical protein